MTDNIRILSESYPPLGVLYLDEEMSSNGMLPYIHIGEYLEQAIWHLAGQMKAPPGVWLGAVDKTDGDVARVADGGSLTRSFLLKPGARDVRISLLVSTDDTTVDEMEVEVTLASGAYSESQIVNRGNPYGVQLIDAWDTGFIFYSVGDYPGMLKNRDKTALLTISPNGADLLLWSFNIFQNHTVQLEQEP